MFHVKHSARSALALLAASALLLTGCSAASAPNGWAGPVASGSNLVIVEGKPGQLVAMNPKDGSRVWQYPDTVKDAGSTNQGGKTLNGTLYARPVVGDGVIYLAAYNGQVTRLNYDGNNRTPAWQIDLKTAVVATPQLRGDRLYIFTEDGHVIVLNAKDGATAATYRPTDGRVWGAPALRDSTFYIGSLDSSDLVALNADSGATEWKQKLAGASAADVVVDGDLLVIASFDRALHGFDAAGKGTERWRFAGDGWFVGAPLVAKHTIYAASMRGTVYALDENGKAIWHRAYADREFRSAPVLVGDTLVVIARDGTAYGLAASDGSERWTKSTDAKVEADGLLLDSTLFYVTAARNLLRLDPTTGAVQSFNTQPPAGGK